ncbi:TRAP transporter large permease subunit [soil metagenome]
MDQNVVLGVIVLLLFGIGAAIMITRTFPAILVLPILGVSIAVAAAVSSGRITFEDITSGVIGQGALKLAPAIIISFFGGMISFVMQKSGVAHSLVKNGAELIGDNPLAVSLFSMGLVALLFTSIGGLGAVIMVSLIVLPMLATVGVQPVVAGGIMLFGLSAGGMMNAGPWVTLSQSLNIPVEQVRDYSVVMFVLTALAGIFFVCVELYRGNTMRNIVPLAATAGSSAIAGVAFIWVFLRHGGEAVAGKVAEIPPGWKELYFITAAPAGTSPVMVIARLITEALLALLVLLIFVDIYKRIPRWRHQVVEIRWYSYLIPIVPLALILIFHMDPLAAFVFGFVYSILSTARPGSVSLTIQSMIQGSATVLPAMMLMVGIGILLTAIMGPATFAAHGGTDWPVISALRPIISIVTPDTPLKYVIYFTIFAPLALYRGPLNSYGLGFGFAQVLIGTGILSNLSVMGVLQSAGQIQGICDPTNTQNVWLANELRVDVQALLWRTIPYVWVAAFVGLAIASQLYPIPALGYGR